MLKKAQTIYTETSPNNSFAVRGNLPNPSSERRGLLAGHFVFVRKIGSRFGLSPPFGGGDGGGVSQIVLAS